MQSFTILALVVAAVLPALSAGGASPIRAPAWDTFSDTWVATDALGRSLPTQPQVGPPRPGKWVGIFYFL